MGIALVLDGGVFFCCGVRQFEVASFAPRVASGKINDIDFFADLL